MSRRSFYLLNVFLLALWFGGFTVYAGIVIPIGSEIIGETTQGFITQRVSFWLNILGTLSTTAMSIWAWTFQRERSLMIWIGILLISLLAQFILHANLTDQLDMEVLEVANRGSFYRMHQSYLWISTLQWLAMIMAFIKIRQTATE